MGKGAPVTPEPAALLVMTAETATAQWTVVALRARRQLVSLGRRAIKGLQEQPASTAIRDKAVVVAEALKAR
jgi:hypothetical protein